MTYFGCDLKHLRAPAERSLDIRGHLIAGFLFAVFLLILIGAIK
jgi:hypothetical protein